MDEPTPSDQTNNHSLSQLLDTLPLELLPIILEFSLPALDFTASEYQWYSFYSHVVALYNLRAVSRMWRDLIDDTPSLWTVISNMLPDEVNETTLIRSQSAYLTLHYIRPFGEPNPADLRAFIDLVTPFQERWGALSLTISPESLEEPLVLMSPSLDTLTLASRNVWGWYPPNRIYKNHPRIELPVEGLRHVHHVCLDSVPLRWSEVLPAFKHLKTLNLHLLEDHDVTTKMILDVLAQNPELEALDIANFNCPPVPPKTFIPTFSLLRLTCIRLEGGFGCVDAVLSHLQVWGSSVKEIYIAFDTFGDDFDPVAAHTFWAERISPLLPSIQKTYSSSASSSVTIQTGRCVWASASSDEELRFTLYLGGLSGEDALKWIQGVISTTGQEPLPPTKIILLHGSIRRGEVLNVVKLFPGLTELDGVVAGSGPSKPHLQPLFNALTDFGAGEATSVGFPTLTTLTLRRWRCDLEDILLTLQKRFSGRSQVPSIPNLAVNLSSKPATWKLEPRSPDPMENIVDFESFQQLAVIEGVERVRVGDCEEYIGMIAVTWSEGLSRPVWVEDHNPEHPDWTF